jgi:formylglycine-generating enzyme required for sulfatase activity
VKQIKESVIRQGFLAISVLVVATLSFYFSVREFRSRVRASATEHLAASDGPASERGVSAASQGRALTSAATAPQPVNTSVPPAPTPQRMVWIRGGEFWMGSDEPMFKDARPWHHVYLDGFWMDKTEVTNDQFIKFVKATGHVTVAEKTPRAEDFPEAPTENLVAGSVVFSPPDHPVPLDDHFRWWSYVKGANWRHPQGPHSDLKGKEKHPVVHVAYQDAEAYCTWEGKRLPTEAEFEFAERGGLDRKPYAWGDVFKPAGKFMANTFQGHFPDKNTAEDGYTTTAPVASFPTNGYGLYDMAGNVWEWTSDWYRPDYYQILAASGEVVRNPQGPADSFDPSEPGVQKKVQRAGSFLCTDQYCSRYMVGGRGKGEPDTGTNHLGFRCVEPVRDAGGTSAKNSEVPPHIRDVGK